MKKVLFSLLAVVLVLTSCGGVDPVKFNDAIANANVKIVTVSDAYQNELGKALEADDYEVIAIQTDSALAKIDAEIAIVKALEVPKGGEAFKDAAIKSYESLRAVVEAGKKFSTLTKESSEEEFSILEKEYDAKSTEYSNSFDALAIAQAEYAKDAGYKVNK